MALGTPAGNLHAGYLQLVEDTAGPVGKCIPILYDWRPTTTNTVDIDIYSEHETDTFGGIPGHCRVGLFDSNQRQLSTLWPEYFVDNGIYTLVWPRRDETLNLWTTSITRPQPKDLGPHLWPW